MEFLIFWTLKIVAALIAVPTAIFLLFSAKTKYSVEQNKKLIIKYELANQFTSQFNDSEIKEAIDGYIVPYYSP